MSELDNTWRAALAGLVETLAHVWEQDREDLPAALVLAFHAAAKAPSHVINFYADWPEDVLRKAADELLPSLTLRGFGYKYAEDENDAACLERLVKHIRALELAVSGDASGDYPPNPDFDWLVTLPDGAEWYLVPVPRRLWGKGYQQKNDGRAFSKRCLFMHRIIPRRVDGTLVRFVPTRAVRRLDGGKVGFGGAVFEKAHFCDAETQSPFKVTEVQLGDFQVVTTEAIENAHKSSSFALVFPELTIDPSGFENVRTLLKEKPFNLPEGSASPVVVVAGSWHVSDGNHTYNVAKVVDGQGKPITEYRKRHSYGGAGRPREAIASGTEFPILLTPEGLVSLAICLDFCNHGTPTLYEQVDVDFVLVASCGNYRTMQGHLHTAYELYLRYSTITFITQQCHPPEQNGRGYVALWREDPSPQADNTRVSAGWTEHFTELSSFPIDNG